MWTMKNRLFVFVLAMVSSTVVAQTVVAPSNQTFTCPLNCHLDSTCEAGEANFQMHPVDINGIPFDYHKVLSKDGYHCECPFGWTGLRCNRPYEQCPGLGDHYCYHGGKCLVGIDEKVDADQLYCDCSSAQHNGVPYVGKFCEVEGAVQCGDTQVFCTNGGTCTADFETKAHPCDCKPGHRGPHCEFDTGFVPDCTLDCQNEGQCMLGIKNYETALYSEFWERHDGNFQYCECKEGFFGHTCEVEGDPCGDNHCFNGASCLQTDFANGEVDYTCDCSTTTVNGTNFAGVYCENEATSFCTEDEDQNGSLFCTNGGTCKEETHEGCDCPDGFKGPICEFRDDQDEGECELTCQNGGKCRNGKKDNALLDQFGDELQKFTETHKLWEHCVCPEGFFGIQCEHQLEICPGGEHVCLHGSKCVPQDEVNGGTDHSCDCDEGFNSQAKYAGKYCQYTSTDICTVSGKPGVGKANFAFCVNDGKCRMKVQDNESHPGCICNEGFTGDHCEFLAVQPTEAELSTSTKSNGGIVTTLAIALLMLAALIGFVLVNKIFLKSDIDPDFKLPPVSDPEPVESGSVAEETVDMQSPASTPSSGSGNLHTVEII